MSIRLLIADDYDAVRENIKSFISSEGDIEIVAAAGDGESAVELAGKVSPDVVLLDISMPKLNGIEAAMQILNNNPAARVIILSIHSKRSYMESAIEAGVLGYILKASIFDDLIPAVHSVMSNELFLSPKIADVGIRDGKKPPSKTSDTDS